MPATATCAPQGVPWGRASPRSAVYRRRQPERTLLYRSVQTHLATWLALHDDGAGATAPALTEREFRRYLFSGKHLTAASSPTALPAPAAPTADMTSSSPIPASAAVSALPAPPAAWWRPSHGGDRRASGRPRHPAFASAPVGALRAQALALVTGNAIRQFSAPHCTFSWPPSSRCCGNTVPAPVQHPASAP